MAESLASRVGRIVSGSVNALLDAVENAAPEVVLEEAIREVDGALDDVRTELGREVAKKHLAGTRLLEENRRHDELTEKVALALREGREDLAEAAVARQLDIEAQIPVLERTLAECGDREKELEAFVGALLARRREMQDELRLVRESRAAAPADGPGSTAAPSGSSAEARVERAVSAFDRVLEAKTGVPGQAGSLSDDARLAELEELARRNRIQERVAQAKAKLESE